MSKSIQYFIGVDVQISRGCVIYVLGRQAEYINSGWATGGTINEICDNLQDAVRQYPSDDIAIGIDAPRIPLKSPRQYYRDNKTNSWRKRGAGDKGKGRHCEVVIKSLGLGNPQWTSLLSDAPEWMRLGFTIFERFAFIDNVFEVFPSASYRMLIEEKGYEVGLNFAHFQHGPKDMLDACMAAFTVYEFINGRGSQVGGGDGLGTIVLPRKIREAGTGVMTWPVNDLTK